MYQRREKRRQKILGLRKKVSETGNERRSTSELIEMKESKVGLNHKMNKDDISEHMHLKYPSEKLKTPLQSKFEKKTRNGFQKQNELEKKYVKATSGSTVVPGHNLDLRQGFSDYNENDRLYEGQHYIENFNEEESQDKDANEEESHDGDANDEESHDDSVVSIELIYCKHCNKSYAPATYEKFCNKLDENGNPKCLRLGNKKRKVFNSAKVK